MAAAERISKVQRWLDLIAFLLGRRRPATVDQIFAAVPAYGGVAGDAGPGSESTRRMFERDKDELRKLGIAILTERFTTTYGTEQADGYVLRANDFFVPYLRLIDEERQARGGSGEIAFSPSEAELILRALAEAGDVPDSPFAEASRRAYRKLGFDLAGDTDDPDESSVGVFLPGRSEITGVARLVSGALQRRQLVRFRYHGAARGSVTERDVAPYGMLMEGGAWYLVGHDSLRRDIRVFHLGRIENPRVAGEAGPQSAYEIPDDFDISAYRQRWVSGSGEGEHLHDDAVVVDVRFQGPWARWAERNHYGAPAGGDEGDAEIRRFSVRHLEPFCDWILGLADGARVVSPESVAREVAERAERIALLHG